ncbi:MULTISPECIES: MFS transporter [Actinotignum]|uniref:MFS transporter n=1 Tax=Actinotignum TaxID=1653174 RepID=UPI00254FC658|nr:MFS transporter [Actinotignum schaalii]MDE1536679.1 MFS transporter [Actinotignum schaalii]MDK7272232.1 MFS transporter [Actinotignum schaalii]
MRQVHPWRVLVCACLLTFITGCSYVFSIFQLPATQLYGLSAAMGAYTLTNALAPLPMLLGGYFIDRGRAVWTATIGALCAAIGWASAACASSPLQFVLGYGFIGGIGMGLVLTSALSNTLRFFPGRRGLISGIISCVNGASGIVMAPLAQRLLDSSNLRTTLLVFSGFYAVIAFIVAFNYRAAPVEGVVAPAAVTAKEPAADSARAATEPAPVPAAEPAPAPARNARPSLTTRQMLATPDFWLIFAIFIAGAFSGLMIVSNAAPIAAKMFHFSAASAALFVSLYACAGTAGRFCFGWLADHLGHARTLEVTFCCDAFGLLLLIAGGRGLLGGASAIGATNGTLTGGIFLAGGLLALGLSYGGTIAIMPACVMDRFGPRWQGINYALAFTGFSVAAIFAPRLGAQIGAMYDGDYTRAFLYAIIASATGLGCARILYLRTRRRRAQITRAA